MKTKLLSLVLVLTQLTACGSLISDALGYKKDRTHKKKIEKPKGNEVVEYRAVNYRSFDEILAEIESIDQDADKKSLQKKLEKSWLWQNMFAHLPKLSKEQRLRLSEILQKQRIPARGAARFEIKTPPSEDFSFHLPPQQSVRIPVKSFCLNGDKHSPEENLRYSPADLGSEPLVRQILFKFLESRTDDEKYQSLMWDLARLSSKISDATGFDEVLKELDFEFDPNETLEDFQKKRSTKERAAELELDKGSRPQGLVANLISTRSFSGGELVFFNNSNEQVEITPKDLKLRFVPTAKQFSGSEVEGFTPESYQNIYTSGVDPGAVGSQEADMRDRLARVNQTNQAIDELIASGKIGPVETQGLNVGRNYASDLLAQGEIEAGDKLYEKVDEFSRALETGVDLATALTPGLNDIRDGYEFATGKDMISGENLELWEQALAGVGMVAGSGVVFRKGVEALARVGEVGQDVFREGLRIGEAVGKAGERGQTVLGHYPEYMEAAQELGARRFEIPDDVWSKMTPTEQWTANQKFLDRTIKRGDDILLATPASKARPGSFFEKELEYLRSQGYEVDTKGRVMASP